MMKQECLRKLCGTAVVALCFTIPALGQIAQDHPELCGNRSKTIALPQGVSAITDSNNGESILTLAQKDSTVTVQLPGVQDEIQQVCPLSGSRLLIFGAAAGSYNINLISQTTGAILDSFYAYSPVLSPDQRWLTMRDFYPAHMEVTPSEEYLLYDLAGSKSSNRVLDTNPRFSAAGRVAYPFVEAGMPFEHHGLPENQTHRFRSDSFYWASTSKAVVFADSVQDTLSTVLITIDDKKIQTFVHPISASEACRQGLQGDIIKSDLMLSNAEAKVLQGDSSIVRLQFRSVGSGAACTPKEVVLQGDDFKPAPTEHHQSSRKGKAPSYR